MIWAGLGAGALYTPIGVIVYIASDLYQDARYDRGTFTYNWAYILLWPYRLLANLAGLTWRNTLGRNRKPPKNHPNPDAARKTCSACHGTLHGTTARARGTCDPCALRACSSIAEALVYKCRTLDEAVEAVSFLDGAEYSLEKVEQYVRLKWQGKTNAELVDDTVEEDVPILAHRAARLLFDGSEAPWASVSYSDYHFGVDSQANCGRYHQRLQAGYIGTNHVAPALNCGCGFYAMPIDLEPSYAASYFVNLMVELSGVVIECDKGYRAQHQRVVECQIPPCIMCKRRATAVHVHNGEMDAAACSSHRNSEKGHEYVWVEDLSKVLGVPVTALGWSNDGDT